MVWDTYLIQNSNNNNNKHIHNNIYSAIIYSMKPYMRAHFGSSE